jgi:putative ABC transport system permease protein
MTDQLRADLYLSPAVPAAADRHPTMSADIVARLARLPGVAAVDQIRNYEISYQGMPATLAGIDIPVASVYQTRTFLSGARAASVFEKMRGTLDVIVSEPFANKHHVRAGDVLTLPLGGSNVRLHVADVFYDYSSERGSIFMDRATLLRYLPDPDPSNLAVYLNPGVSPDEARRMVQAAVADRHVLVFLNRSLREQGMRIFDRTFAITYALEAVAVFVAVMGVGGALLALVIDRRREFGLLRFLGAADAQVRRMILFEAGFLGLLANLAGLILGFALSLLLIYVIDKQSFGWTIQFHWPVTVLLSAIAIVYAATLLAGLYPARIATQLVPIEVIHEE